MSPAKQWRIGVVGAPGPLGSRIVEELVLEPTMRIIATSRDVNSLSDLYEMERVECRELDLQDVKKAAAKLLDCEVVVFCPILTLSAPVACQMRAMGSGARFIMLSSNNVGLDDTAPVYQKLALAEKDIQALKEPWAIIRPTMIYGEPDDGNLGRLLQLCRKSPFLPLFGSGNALQQPIHYDDLCELILELVLNLEWHRFEISAAGPDIVSLTDLYEEIVRASGSRTKIIRIPVQTAMKISAFMERFGVKPPLSSAQLARVEKDKLPTWPLLGQWEGDITVEEGLARLAAMLKRK